MIVRLDFKASFVARGGFPIEVAWAVEGGTEAAYLIRPAPGWTVSGEEAESTHRIPRAVLDRKGKPHADVAPHGGRPDRPRPPCLRSFLRRPLALAPSSGGRLPTEDLTLRDSDDLHAEAAISAFRRAGLDPAAHAERIRAVVAAAKEAAEGEPPAHRALDGDRREFRHWREVTRRAEAAVRP